MMTHTLGERFWLDLLFFFVVLIVMLNIIFGIIIDTFAELRTNKVERLEDTREKCFICGVDRGEFNKASDSTLGGFHTHYHADHNMWAYFYFMVHIWEQDKDDDDGLELYVRKKLKHVDPTWFPVGQALCLGKHEDSEEVIIQSKVSQLEEQFEGIKSDVQTSFEKLEDLMFKIQASAPEGR